MHFYEIQNTNTVLLLNHQTGQEPRLGFGGLKPIKRFLTLDGVFGGNMEFNGR